MKVQTENGSFLRDTHSKALLMKDRKQVDDYKLRSKLLKAAQSKEDEINTLKTQVADIENTLHNDVMSRLDEITNILKGIVSK